MQTYVFGMAIFFFFALVIAISLTLDDIIRTLRDKHQEAWIEAGRPRESFLGFGIDFRLFGGLIRSWLGFSLLFKKPEWAKRDQKLRTLVFRYRALHVSMMVLITLVVLLQVLLQP